VIVSKIVELAIPSDAYNITHKSSVITKDIIKEWINIPKGAVSFSRNFKNDMLKIIDANKNGRASKINIPGSRYQKEKNEIKRKASVIATRQISRLLIKNSSLIPSKSKNKKLKNTAKPMRSIKLDSARSVFSIPKFSQISAMYVKRTTKK